jgi:hypothetical protein
MGSALWSTAERSNPLTMGALGASALFCEAGVVRPRAAALAKTAKTKAVLIRIILAPISSKRTHP